MPSFVHRTRIEAPAGPFRRWEHTHRVVPDGAGACTLEDNISYELPFGAVGRLLGGRCIVDKLLLAGQRVLPERLQQTKYRFRHTELDATFRHLLGMLPQETKR